MTSRVPHLCLGAAASVPVDLAWMIEDGYLRLTSCNDGEDSVTLGVWGPGELVIPALIGCAPIALLSLSPARLRNVHPTAEQREAFLLNQILQSATLLRISRSRPAEFRLVQVLFWLGERFGRVSSRGVSLSFAEMNLTHRNLAEISGLTRVTVTKAFSNFRQAGYLQKEGSDELLHQDSLHRIRSRGAPLSGPL